jgi:hypothetical protein
VPVRNIERLEPAAPTSTTKLNLAQFERRPGEVLLRADVLGHSVINVNTARLVTAGEVELIEDDGAWRVAGIDTSLGAGLRRRLPRACGGSRRCRRHSSRGISSSRSSGTCRRRACGCATAGSRAAPVADRRPRRGRSHDEGEEILAAVGQDKELEADVFEELDDEHQLEFLDAALRPRGRLGAGADGERRRRRPAARDQAGAPAAGARPAAGAKQRKIRKLLGYNPSTAGGVMSPDFVAVPAAAPAARRSRARASATSRPRRSHDPADRQGRHAQRPRHRRRADRGGARRRLLARARVIADPPSVSAEAEVPRSRG